MLQLTSAAACWLLTSLATDLNLEKNRIRDDINLERNRVRDGLQGMRDKANELEIKMDKEVNMLRAAVEQSKNEVRFLVAYQRCERGRGSSVLLTHTVNDCGEVPCLLA